MKRIIVVLLASAMITQIATRGASHDDSRDITSVFDQDTYLKSTVGPSNVGNCLIVYGDGRLHLELRRQEFLGEKASFGTYLAVLSKDLASLHSILDIFGIRPLWMVHSRDLPRRSNAQSGLSLLGG